MKIITIQCCEFCEENINKKVKGCVIKCNFDCDYYACLKCFQRLKEEVESLEAEREAEVKVEAVSGFSEAGKE